MTDRTIIDAVAAHAEALFAKVQAGQANPYDALACLVADVLGTASEPAVDPDTRAELHLMCSSWALHRRHALQAEGLLRADPVPDNVANLLGDDSHGG